MILITDLFFEIPCYYITWSLILLTSAFFSASVCFNRKGKIIKAFIFLFFFFFFLFLLLTWDVFIAYEGDYIISMRVHPMDIIYPDQTINWRLEKKHVLIFFKILEINTRKHNFW